VRELFARARQVAPCVVFFDELDALAPARGVADSQTAERVVAQLLTEIDGIQGLQGVIVVAATNRPELIDPALLRPGRFDMLVALPPPDDQARLAILRVHSRSMPLAADVDLARIAATTKGLAGAELEALCRRAALGAVREQLAVRLESRAHSAEAELDSLHVAARHFDDARRELAAERQALSQEV
jgi:transitional endoplasmic reticulum ATPase